MIIELQRQWVAGDRAYWPPEGSEASEDRCGICGRAFKQTSIVAWAHTDDRTDAGLACEACIEYLGRRNPEEFPTIEVYRELLAMYPEPMYPSEEALEAAAEPFEDPADIAYEPSWVWRRPLESVK